METEPNGAPEIADYEAVDVTGTIASVIARLRALQDKYPDGELAMEEWTEYGEHCSELVVMFKRKKTQPEIELQHWKDKLSAFRGMSTEWEAYTKNGDVYPRLEELQKVISELGEWAPGSCSGELYLCGEEVVMCDINGYYRRDGSCLAKVFNSFGGAHD